MLCWIYENIKSLTSNYELDKPVLDIEFNKDINEEEIKELCNKKLIEQF